MAISSLVVRAGVGAWSDIAHLITRGLDIGAAAAFWNPENQGSISWANEAAASGTWTPETPLTITWTKE